MLDAVLRLISALLRHGTAYAELFAAEATAALQGLQRRLLGWLVAAVAANLALLMGCAWVIAATWDGPRRLPAIAALCGGFAVVALAGVWIARSATRAPGERAFARLAAEWDEDVGHLAAWTAGGATTATPGTPIADTLHVD